MPSFLTTAQVADKYGVDSSTVRRWILDGRITAQRIGLRLLVVDEAELDEFRPPRKGRPKKKETE